MEMELRPAEFVIGIEIVLNPIIVTAEGAALSRTPTS
jgi:hypothetical protein